MRQPDVPPSPELERAKLLASMGEQAARTLLPLAARDGRYSDAHLWVLFHGFAGGFSAAVEVVSKSGGRRDSPLAKAFARWWPTVTDEYHVRVKAVRNLMVHQGKHYTTMPRQEWKPDPFNDTDYPVLSHIFATVTRGGHEVELTFDEWARDQFTWLGRQLAELERLYRREYLAAARTEEYRSRLAGLKERHP